MLWFPNKIVYIFGESLCLMIPLIFTGVHEHAAQVFLLSIRSARQNIVLSALPRYTQDLVLCHTWSQLFLLHCISWSVPLTADCGPDVCHLMMACQDLKLNPIETNLLETLLLCKNGNFSDCVYEIRNLVFDCINLEI